jgi:hypothetical protein
MSLGTAEHIVASYTLTDVQKELAKAKPSATIFLDVDDTLITPQSKVFRATSPYRFMIDEIKQNKKDLKNFEIILSHWRLQRKSILVSDEWPELINNLKIKHAVYALTKMETGPIGAIPSMEEWRYKELSQKGIIFSHTQEYDYHFSQQVEQAPAFYKGIFITGSHKKSDVVRKILQGTTPSQIIFVDDREEHLLDVAEECQKQGIPFQGILFIGAELLKGQPDVSVAEFQKRYLLENAQWLEDVEAEEMLLNTK